MRIFLVVFLSVALLLNNGCAIYEMETTNRGGYLDYVLDKHWLKADSKGMRALRAFAMQVSLARIASVSAKNESDRQLLAIRIGALTKRFLPIYLCAFNGNPLGVEGTKTDPCFYYDSAMVDYSTGLFDLAMVALPVEDAKRLVNTVAGAVVNPIDLIELLNTLLQIGQDAIKYGRIVGALYRDTVELEVQVWLATPDVEYRPSFRVTPDDLIPLREAYRRGNDDMKSWLLAIAELRGRGLEPIAQPKFFGELAGLMNYLCDLITKDPDANNKNTCKANLPETLPVPAVVLGDAGNFKIGDARVPSLSINGKLVASPKAAPTNTPDVSKPMGGALTALERGVSTAAGRQFQQALCVTPSDSFDKDTRAQIKSLNAAFLYPTDSAATDQIAKDSEIQNLREARKQFPDCRAAGFVSGYEVGLFTHFGPDVVRKQLAEALKKASDDVRQQLGVALQKAGIAAPSDFATEPVRPLVIDKATRLLIGQLAGSYGLSGSEMTKDFYAKMLSTIER